MLTDGTHTIELYHLQNFGHHDGMLLVYLPKEKVLLEADGYNPQPATATPPNPPSPYTVSLLDNIRAAEARRAADRAGALPGRQSRRDDGGLDEVDWSRRANTLTRRLRCKVSSLKFKSQVETFNLRLET